MFRFVQWWQLELPESRPRNCVRQWASSARQSPAESVLKRHMHWWHLMSYSRECVRVQSTTVCYSETSSNSVRHTHSRPAESAQETSTRLTDAQPRAYTSHMTSAIKVLGKPRAYMALGKPFINNMPYISIWDMRFIWCFIKRSFGFEQIFIIHCSNLLSRDKNQYNPISCSRMDDPSYLFEVWPMVCHPLWKHNSIWNVICKMTMQCVKWHCVLYLNLHYHSSNVWFKMKIHNLHLPFHTLVLICILKRFISGKIKMPL